ncbi:MAG: glycosyltransferase family 4 protein [Crocinitomicaceae bacterium]|nr:glycosyltransferase family 4 protein [Crocinitomicaceae bacterium]
MLIAVNTRLLLKDRLEGMGWFAYESLKRITKNHPEHQFLFLFDRPFSEEFIFSDNITPIVVGPQARHPFLWYWWLEQALPKVLHKHDPDLFLSPDGFLPLAYSSPAGPKQCKFLPVIHDLYFEHYPQEIPFLASKFFKRYFSKYVKKANRIATVSEYSRQDISSYYKVNPDKIDVVYDGANELFKPLAPTLKGGNAGYPLGQVGAEYFLFVGALSPRKNVARLLQAFDEFKKTSSSNVKLVIVGEKLFMTSDIGVVYEKMQFKAEVIFTGRLGTEELSSVMASALALVFVPYFEGFGIPILEAMYCDVPVITSNVTSMPEVAGEAGLLVDPFSIDSIKDAMLKIYNDEALRNKLIENGRKQRENFSWDKTAEKLWGSIEKTI